MRPIFVLSRMVCVHVDDDEDYYSVKFLVSRKNNNEKKKKVCFLGGKMVKGFCVIKKNFCSTQKRKKLNEIFTNLSQSLSIEKP